MKKLIVSLTIIILSISVAHAGRKDVNIGHLFGGVTNQLSPAALRLGHKSYELGLLGGNALMYHFNKVMNVSSQTYATFGLGYSFNANQPGILGGIGWEFIDLKIINFRFELIAYATANNHTYGNAILGINLNL